jgi:ATP-dependent HslUV protease subunit HslV
LTCHLALLPNIIVVVSALPYAGATADAMTLLDRLENKMEEYPGQLKRACVEMAKQWRTDKFLRPLEATMIVCDATVMLQLTGNGDVFEPVDNIVAIGSGSPYATGSE